MQRFKVQPIYFSLAQSWEGWIIPVISCPDVLLENLANLGATLIQVFPHTFEGATQGRDLEKHVSPQISIHIDLHYSFIPMEAWNDYEINMNFYG